MTEIIEKVSFLGLGKMGFNMAKHLSKLPEVQLTLWNRTNIFQKTDISAPDLLSEFSRSTTVASSAHDAIRASKVIMMMLWDAQSIRDVLDGLTEADYKERVFISHVTISPKESKDLSEFVIGKGGKFLEAPVLGNAQVAERGALQTLVGGNKELFDKYTPLFKMWGIPRYLGDVGAATATKLSLNFLLGSNLVAFATSYGYLDRKGVDLDAFMTILTNGPFNLAGGYHAVWADKFKKRNYDAVAFSTVGLDKDLELASIEFESAGVRSASAKALSATAHEAASRRDLSTLDMTALYELINADERQA